MNIFCILHVFLVIVRFGLKRYFFPEQIHPDTKKCVENIKESLDSLSFWTWSVVVTNYIYLK